jgi:hypothetical protein
MELKTYIAEAFKKEYGFRVKIAADCGSDHMDILEKCLAKYNVTSIAPFNRTPIQENPQEFQRAKGATFTSEVCSTDISLKYPVNERILEVWLAVNLGLDHERVLCYNVKEPRKLESDLSAERLVNDVDRTVTGEDAELAKEEMAHYENENAEIDLKDAFFGEEYNKKFLDELAKIKAEKGADYFSNYPSKDELMGDNLKPTYDDLTGRPNMGKGAESTKQVTNIFQSGGNL